MLDGVVQMELLCHAHNGHNVVRAVCMEAAAHLTADNRNQSVKLEVRLRGLGWVGLGFLEGIRVVLSLVQSLAQDSGNAHAGAGHLFAGAVVALWIFAKSKFHLLAVRNDHFLSGVAAQLDGNAGAADDISRAGGRKDGGESGFTNRDNGVVVRIDCVCRPNMGLDRAAHLIAVVHTRHGVWLVEVADMGMTVNQTRGDPAAFGVDDFGTFRNREVGSDCLDFSIFNQDGCLFIGLAGHGDDPAVDDCFHGKLIPPFKVKMNAAPS